MSVCLTNVTKLVKVQGEQKPLFFGLNLQIERGAHVGVLALPKSGKTTLIRLVAGLARPDGGEIRRDMSVSWPIPMTDFAVGHSSIAWNVRSVARIYGVKDENFVGRVAELGGLTDLVNTPIEKCPVYARGQLGFAIGIAMDFDLYLFDNLIVPSRKEFKDEALEHLRERTDGKAILLATSALQSVVDCCDIAYVLENGQLTPFQSVKEGADYFKALQKAEAERKKAALEQQSGGDEGRDTASEEYDRAVELVQAGAADLL